jgi:hypothetical protein
MVRAINFQMMKSCLLLATTTKDKQGARKQGGKANLFKLIGRRGKKTRPWLEKQAHCSEMSVRSPGFGA